MTSALSSTKEMIGLHAVQLQRVLGDDDPVSFAARLQLVVDGLAEALRAARDAGLTSMRESGEVKIGFASDGFVYTVQLAARPRYELRDNRLDQINHDIETLTAQRKARETELKKTAQPVDMAYTLRVTAVPAAVPAQSGEHHG